MRWIQSLVVRVRMLFRRERAAARLDDELGFHLDRQVAENVAAGMSAVQARQAALRAFGNPALVRDLSRATWSWSAFESLLHDVRYGARSLRRSPGFALIAVVVMALGIGANVALFTVVRSVLLKPLPFHDPDRLVTLYQHDSSRSTGSQFMPVDAGSFWEWQRATRGVAELAMVSPWQEYSVSAEGGKLPEQVEAAWCSWNFFEVLGVQPALGRGFAADDDREGASATVLLSHAFWKRRYAGDPNIVGKTIWMDAKPYTAIGVLPESFVYNASMGSGNETQVWTPVMHEAPPELMHIYNDHEFLIAGRLAPGVTLAQLLGQLGPLQKRIHVAQGLAGVHDTVNGRSMLDDAIEDYKTPLYALLAATACVLLIACMNVAGLLVARAAARSKDLAIRAAMGGGRLRLLRERLIESALLSAMGGLAGMTLAWGALRWLVATRADMHRIESIQMDGAVAGFTFGIVALCALFSGLVSALSAGGRHILGALQDGSRGHTKGAGRAQLRRVLLALQVGLTVVLLVGAGLLARSFQRLRSSDIGIPLDNVLTMFFSLPEARYKTEPQQVEFFETLIAKVRALPGVDAAGLGSQVPGEGWGGDHLMTIMEHPPMPKGEEMDFMVRGADPGYFNAVRLPILRGRTFRDDERLNRANVALISAGAAKRYFPGEDPIGMHLRQGTDGDVWEIIGIVGDSRWNIAVPPAPTLYWPIYGNDYSVARIIVRSSHDVASLAIPVQKILGSMDPDLPVSGVMTLREAIGKSTLDSEFDSILVLGFAAIALLLAATGLYGVLSYLVTQRTAEIGIRIALGSGRERVLRQMLFDGLRPALAGLALGLAGSAAAVREIQSMLYETEPLDPAVFAAVAAMLLVVAAVACLLPAWRASRLNPVSALRAE